MLIDLKFNINTGNESSAAWIRRRINAGSYIIGIFGAHLRIKAAIACYNSGVIYRTIDPQTADLTPQQRLYRQTISKCYVINAQKRTVFNRPGIQLQVIASLNGLPLEARAQA